MLSPTTPVCVPQDHLEAVMLDHLAALPTARLQRGVEAIGLSRDSDTTRVTVRDHARRGELDRCPIRRRRRRGPQPGSERGRHRDARPRPSVSRSSRSSSAPHSGMSSATTPYLLYTVTDPDAPGVVLPAGTDDRWRYGFEWSPQTETLADYPDERTPPPHRSVSRSREPARRDRARRPVLVRRADRGHLPRRRRLPHRRRGASHHSPRRHRHEHGDRRWLRSRLEAGVGAEGLGTGLAARQLRARTSTHRRAQPFAVSGGGRKPPQHPRRGAHRPPWPHQPPLGAGRGRPRVDP